MGISFRTQTHSEFSVNLQLKELDQSVARVVQALYDENVPPSLMSMDRAAPLEKKVLRGERAEEEESSVQTGSGSGGGKRASNSLAFQSRGKRRRKERDNCSSERYMTPHDNDTRQFEEDVGQIRECHLRFWEGVDMETVRQVCAFFDETIGEGFVAAMVWRASFPTSSA
jgi:hypothetical protein